MDGNDYNDNAAAAMVKAINNGDADGNIGMIANALHKRHEVVTPKLSDMTPQRLLELIEALDTELSLVLVEDNRAKLMRNAVGLHNKMEKARKALDGLQQRLPRPDSTLDACQSRLHEIVTHLLREAFEFEP